MPHDCRFRLTEMSCSPSSSRRTISFRRMAGSTRNSPERMSESSRSRYRLSRKKWLFAFLPLPSIESRPTGPVVGGVLVVAPP